MKFFIGVVLLVVTTSVLAKEKTAEKKIHRADDALKAKREAPISSGYHGPSYKYLPPSPAITGSASGYDSYNNHHSHTASAAGIGNYDYSNSGNGAVKHFGGANLETYVVKYNTPLSLNAFSSLGGSDFSGHAQRESGSNHAGHRVQTFILPLNHFSSKTAQGASSSYTYPKGSSGQNSFSGRFGDSSTGTSFAHGGYGSAGFSNGQISGLIAGGSGYHYAPPNLSSISGPAEPSIGPGYNAFVSNTNEHGSHVNAAFGGGGTAGSTFSGSVGQDLGYSYEPSFAHSTHDASIGTSFTQKYHNSGNAINGIVGVDDQPAYALGHKGLGHFGLTSSKAHTLNTDIIGSTKYIGSVHSASKAPFKPSTFLGSTHEDGGAGYSNSPSTEYLPPFSGGNDNVGYEYHPPALLYGAPAHSGDSATPIQEPDSSYLPPIQSNFAPPLH